MQEIEAKFYLQDLNQMRVRLQMTQARLLHDRVFEQNLRFDLPDSGLRAKGRVMRLRRDDEIRLTYKGAQTNTGGVLSRTEIEFAVDDFDMTKRFLEALGYQVMLEYEKFRTTFALSDTVHVMLDELPYGNFIEIEAETVESVHAAADSLDLTRIRAIAKSYTDLFEHAKTELGLNFRDLTFENFKGIAVKAAHIGVEPADEGNQPP